MERYRKAERWQNNKHKQTFCWVCWLILVDSRLDVAEGRRGRTLLQDADGITELISKLNTQSETIKDFIIHFIIYFMYMCVSEHALSPYRV